jgi:multicomponent Na+:H+ antiporter subunit G
VSTFISNLLILGGVLLIVLAGVAVLRLPNVLARANAATKAAGLGLASVLAGVAVGIGTRDAYIKLGLAIVVQFITAPVAGHVLGRASYRAQPEVLSAQLDIDDLAVGDGDVPRPGEQPRRPSDQA